MLASVGIYAATTNLPTRAACHLDECMEGPLRYKIGLGNHAEDVEKFQTATQEPQAFRTFNKQPASPENWHSSSCTWSGQLCCVSFRLAVFL
jgi:hypothetical protein